jgi:DNA replication protein DnaC
METISTICLDCKSTFNAELILFNGRPLFSNSICEPCLSKRIHENDSKRDQEILNAKNNAFWSEVPKMYAETDKSRLQAILVAAIDGYDVASRDNSTKGLGIIGKSGAGKTRTAVEILHKAHLAGKTICYLKATKLTQAAQDRFHSDDQIKNQAEARIRRAYKSQVLFLDDLGKGRLPNSAEELLYDIIDERCERGLPIIWTSNAGSKELKEMFSSDRGIPILRRLAEFCNIINL